MTPDEIKAAVAADDSLNEAFHKWAEEKGVEVTTLAIKEGFKAWEWCLRQLMARGADEQSALAMRSIYIGKQARLGTYGAIQECLFGDAITLVVT